ncbi:MAG TPA: hypothetical protein VGR63_13050 [Casimicrobiaceae bacterium]|nr:hypothetical protein [Casimicrobiaceae bacterium]
MRTWARAIVPMLCGGCNRQLAKGDPVLLIDITYRAGRSIRRSRCDRCEGPAPPDLPALIERSNAITPTPLKKMAAVLPFGRPLADWRARQSGEREPGEEG